MVKITPGSWGYALGPLSTIDLGITEALGVGGNNLNRAPAIGPESGLAQQYTQQYNQQQNPNLVSTNANINPYATNIVNQQQPTTTTRTPTPAPTPTPSGGGDWGAAWADYQKKGWTNEASARGDWEAKGRPSMGGGGQDDMMRRIEELYNISTGALNELYQNIQNVELPTALAGLETQRGQLARQLQTAQTEAEQEFTGQEEEAQDYKLSAAQEARNAYKALEQRIQAGYGAGKSTGVAMTEIAQQAFYKTSGTINEKWNKTMNTIFQERGRVFKYLKDKEFEIEENFQQKIREVNTEFSSRLQEINMQKAMNEQAKSAAKIEVLQQAQSRAQEWEDAQKLARLNLEIYRQQVEIESQAAVDWTTNTVANAFSDQGYQQTKTLEGVQAPLQSLDYTAYTPYSTAQKPYYLKEQEDKFKKVINPFA